MGSQGYRETYLAALEVAHSDLDRIFQEYRTAPTPQRTNRGRIGSAGTLPSVPLNRQPTSSASQSRSKQSRFRSSANPSLCNPYSTPCRCPNRSFQPRSRPCPKQSSIRSRAASTALWVSRSLNPVGYSVRQSIGRHSRKFSEPSPNPGRTKAPRSISMGLSF